MGDRIPIHRESAQSAGFWTKKRLGQHLLRDPEVAAESISSLGLKDGEGILEIGPGLGALAESLLATGAVVLAVEVDPTACVALQQRFGPHERFKLLHADSLQADCNAEAPTPFRGVPFH